MDAEEEEDFYENSRIGKRPPSDGGGEPALPILTLYYELRGRHHETTLQRRVQQFFSVPRAQEINFYETVDRFAESVGYKRWRPRISNSSEYESASTLIADPFNYGWKNKQLPPSTRQYPVPKHYSPEAAGFTTWGWRLYQRRRNALEDAFSVLMGVDKKFIACTWVTWSITTAPRWEHLQTSFAAMPFFCACLDTERPELRDDASLDALKKPIDTIIGSMRSLLGTTD
jgi:hypothetical protein